MIGFIPLHSYILIYFHKSSRYQPIITWFFELVLWTSLDSRDTAPTQITRKKTIGKPQSLIFMTQIPVKFSPWYTHGFFPVPFPIRPLPREDGFHVDLWVPTERETIQVPGLLRR
jgi:hypothetical protein